jgi:hypothetical protein
MFSSLYISRTVFLLVAAVFSASGCVVVGGYSSDRGFWIWPGTFVLLGIALLLFFVLRRRR